MKLFLGGGGRCWEHRTQYSKLICILFSYENYGDPYWCVCQRIHSVLTGAEKDTRRPPNRKHEANEAEGAFKKLMRELLTSMSAYEFGRRSN